VIEEHKLIFFTTPKVGCTAWKQLFRRIMGAKDWQIEGDHKAKRKGLMIPHNPAFNGLKYLYHCDRETASQMMTSPEYTRAIFVRDPKERLLSAYLDKDVANSHFIRIKCCPRGDCIEKSKESLAGFFDLMQTCENAHWNPQSRRVEPKYWPYINFVGPMETVTDDSERLLKQIGAWDKHGKSGWGEDGNVGVFGTKAGGGGRIHATNARERLRNYFTPELEEQVDLFYTSDYESLVMNLTKRQVSNTSDSESLVMNLTKPQVS
jgi:hypothetical protein